MYNPKYISCVEKWKQQIGLHFEAYSIEKNSLRLQIGTKLKPYLNFIDEVQKYLIEYNNEIVKIKNTVDIL